VHLDDCSGLLAGLIHEGRIAEQMETFVGSYDLLLDQQEKSPTALEIQYPFPGIQVDVRGSGLAAGLVSAREESGCRIVRRLTDAQPHDRRPRYR
jgi:hypothetical protein